MNDFESPMIVIMLLAIIGVISIIGWIVYFIINLMF